ncbi:MAG: molybdenum cofactor biosynthesis protein MoaE [Deltaproteobacteria bacterium]|nr:molybdenum cofactor biosynthesis protein MoaE [Deltaproteobacteria bacterium]
MDINGILKKIQEHPDSDKMGMIASHLGVVRGSSRDGRIVTRIEVSYDHEIINNIIRDIKSIAGIVELVVDINEGQLEIGDTLMFVAVGGDIREHVFPALIEAVDRIKRDACKKKEFFEKN